MALIVKRGKLPATPHTEYYAKPGVLALEEIHGTYGFSGAYSRKLHARLYPTEVVKSPARANFNLQPKIVSDLPLQPFHLLTGRIPFGRDFVRARMPLLAGPTTCLSVSKPFSPMPDSEFFRNGDAHEMIFVQEGSGTLSSEYGDLPFKPRQYLIVPKGTTYRVASGGKAFFLIVESLYPIHFAPHHLNAQGQATLMAPVVETEIGLPQWRQPRDLAGQFKILAKHQQGRISQLTLGHHPFDLVGWEGALYPFSFDSADHHSISREIHTAPPARQTFQSGTAPHNGFSICTFRAEMEGWHPKNVPAPYAHFNVDSDEVMFFSDANYGARKGIIEPGSITFHPGSVPHSPHGKAAEKSTANRGKVTSWLAVMLDTFFESLLPTAAALRYSDKHYPLSWHRAR